MPAAHLGAATQHGQRGWLPLLDRAPGQRQLRGLVHVAAETDQECFVDDLLVRLRKFVLGRAGGGPAAGELQSVEQVSVDAAGQDRSNLFDRHWVEVEVPAQLWNCAARARVSVGPAR
ncbi:hypothetical protein [Streptomyces sp. NPDC059651]|uniref:hypothetical protein n=1 Tax=Streptomyces sp. NPDC059651 TaxID=3346897 RepID=UPI00368830F0